jgi:hypothetical protein
MVDPLSSEQAAFANANNIENEDAFAYGDTIYGGEDDEDEDDEERKGINNDGADIERPTQQQHNLHLH